MKNLALGTWALLALVLVLSSCTQVVEEEQMSEESEPTIKVGNASGNVVEVTPSTIHRRQEKLDEQRGRVEDQRRRAHS